MDSKQRPTMSSANGDDSPTKSDEFDPLADYTREDIWCKRAKITRRTGARYRQQGLRFMYWGPWVYIHNEGGREFMLGRVKRLNQPKRRRHGGSK
jgi:hypothetical protein